MEPERAAVVAGACVILHNLGMMWRVPYDEPEEPAGQDQHPHQQVEDDDVQGATMRRYITHRYFA